MICKQCNGSGKTYNPGYGEENCCRCNGTGLQPLTNEEWFCSLSTEEKAEWLIDQFSRVKNNDYMDYKPIGYNLTGIKQWLKEKHTE